MSEPARENVPKNSFCRIENPQGWVHNPERFTQAWRSGRFAFTYSDPRPVVCIMTAQESLTRSDGPQLILDKGFGDGGAFWGRFWR